MSKTQPLYTRDIELLEAGVNKVETQTVGNQTWSRENLCVESYHEEILYYTTRWDALCPYIDVTPEMMQMAKKPFIWIIISKFFYILICF